jgi:RND family efflux transporter MFP subunit
MKVFTIDKCHGNGSASVGDSGLSRTPKIDCRELARWRTKLLVACIIALLVIPGAVLGSEVLEQKFDGIVAPRLWVQVVPQVDGVISRILVTPGQHVSKGDVLFEIDPEAFAIDVRLAQSELAEARARLTMAEDAADRQAQLVKQNATAKQLARSSQIEVEIARAIVGRKEGELAKAQLALSRTRVAAPLSGTVGHLHVAPGAFVEATTGTVLVEIARLDPILVSFYVPYVERQRAFDTAGTSSVNELFQKSTLSLELPSGKIYEYSSKPGSGGGEIDQTTSMMTLWAEFSNPNNVLVPGLKLRVISRLAN